MKRDKEVSQPVCLQLRLCVVSVCASLALIGCGESHSVTINLMPSGGAIKRDFVDSKLLVRDGETTIPYGVGDRVAHHYANGSVRSGRASAFFDSSMPDDVGGSGVYRHKTTEIGDSFLYMERFRGPTRDASMADLTLINERVASLESEALELLTLGSADSKVGVMVGDKERWRVAVHSVLFGEGRDFFAEIADLVESIAALGTESNAPPVGPPSSIVWSLRKRLEVVRNEKKEWEDAHKILGLTVGESWKDPEAIAAIREEMLSLLDERAEAVARGRAKMDPWSIVAEIDELVDWGVDDVIRWWGWELSAHPHWPRIKDSLDGALRRDIKSFLLLLYNADLIGLLKEDLSPSIYGDVPGSDAHAEVLLFLEERGSDMGQVARELESFGDDSDAALILYMQRLLESYFDVPLPFMEVHRIEASYDANVERNSTNVPNVLGGDHLIFALYYVISGNMPFDFGVRDYLNVNLSVPSEPVVSNGSYDPSRGLVSWRGLDLRSENTPLVLYCHWVTPNEEWQRLHLGSPDALVGKELSAYVSGCEALEHQDREAWNSFIAGLEPNESGIRSLQEFSFPGRNMSAHELLPELLTAAIR